MRLRVAKKVFKKHQAQTTVYRQSTLDRASKRLKLTERLKPWWVQEEGWSSSDPHTQAPTPVAVKAEQTDTDYTSMSVADLKAAAKEQGLKGYSKLKKAELIDLLQS